jgi:hypothetical protein
MEQHLVEMGEKHHNEAAISGALSPNVAAEFLPVQAFNNLKDAIVFGDSYNRSPASGSRPPNKSDIPKNDASTPRVILEFDEAHTMTEHWGSSPTQWSNFGELRRALRALSNCALFSLFLSTAGKMIELTPGRDHDLSARIMAGTLTLINPFTDLGFDQLAHKIMLDGTWSLETAVSDDFIFRLGRPL